jgi:hypothetical protein
LDHLSSLERSSASIGLEQFALLVKAQGFPAESPEGDYGLLRSDGGAQRHAFAHALAAFARTGHRRFRGAHCLRTLAG